jgi:hypothetical protein
MLAYCVFFAMSCQQRERHKALDNALREWSAWMPACTLSQSSVQWQAFAAWNKETLESLYRQWLHASHTCGQSDYTEFSTSLIDRMTRGYMRGNLIQDYPWD